MEVLQYCVGEDTPGPFIGALCFRESGGESAFARIAVLNWVILHPRTLVFTECSFRGLGEVGPERAWAGVAKLDL